LANSAVGSREHGVGIQQRTTAKVGATLLQRHDEGEVASGSGYSTHDLSRIGMELRCREGDCGNRKSEECVNHCVDCWAWE
jgi:hypothetical protein